MIARRLKLVAWMAVVPLIHIPAGRAAQNPAPKVCVVLSGGEARGAAHLGVLQVLEHEGIPIDLIVGASFGSLVGGLYALGYKADEIEKIFVSEELAGVFSNIPSRSLDPMIARSKASYQIELRFRDYTPELPKGILSGQRLMEILDRLTIDRMLAAGFDFDKLSIPFRAVATNLINGEKFVFHDGTMTEAIRASIAIPLIFTPVEKDGMLLIDGGLIDNLPTDVARDMGATIVIAVDVTSPMLSKDQIKTLVQVADQSLGVLKQDQMEESLKRADLVLRPDLKAYTGQDYALISEIARRGAEEAESKLSAIKALVADIPRRPARPAPALASRPAIASISFAGLNEVPAEQLRREIRSKPGQPVDPSILEGDVRRLYASGLFEQVHYRLTSAGPEKYHLIFALRESAIHTLGAALRVDGNYGFVALAEFRARQVLRTPSIFTLSTQFGGLENDAASLRLIPSQHLPYFVITPEAHYSRRKYQDWRDGTLVDEFKNRQLGAEFRIGALFRKGEISIGYRMDRATISGGTTPKLQSGVLQMRGLRMNLDLSTLDSQDFPHAGTLLVVRADERMKALASDVSFSRYEADLRQYLPISHTSNIQLSGSAGYSRRSMPFYEDFYVGGFSYSDGGPRRLMGFEFDEFAAKQMGLLSVSYRYRWFSRAFGFARQGFLTGYFNSAAVSSQEKSPYDFTFYHGAGAEFSLDTIVGPLRFAGGWGEGGRFNIYFSFGTSF
jgi:NTE family protein